MKINQQSRHIELVQSDVFRYSNNECTFSNDDISFLKTRAGLSKRKRARICFHSDDSAQQQEMLICIRSDCYIAPEYHMHKFESLFVIEGNANLYFFDGSGVVTSTLVLGEENTDSNNFVRIPPKVIHCLVPKSDTFVFIENTIGPFDRNGSEKPHWAPSEGDTEGATEFLDSLAKMPK